MRRRIGTAVAAALLMGAVALAQGVADAAVQPVPATGTPQLATSGTDGTVEQVRQIVQCGTTMYAVGLFSAVKNGGSTAVVARNNAFAFSATSNYRITAWNPNVNGQVDTVACGLNGTVLLGGKFTQVGTTAVKNIALVDGTNGVVQPTFKNTIGGRVAHIEVVQGHALVGGYFSGYLTSLNPATGQPDGYGMPSISGSYSFPGVTTNPTRVWNMTVSPNQAAVLVSGDFTLVGGVPHEQLFRLNLTPGAATVSAWAPAILFEDCATVEPFYAQDAAWSTDMQTIFTATTGYKPYTASRSGPRTGPCDAAIAFPATEQANVGTKWINYTGCDSLFSVAADSDTVYIAGHERFIDNGDECDRNTAGSPGRAQPGLGEIPAASTNGVSTTGPSRGRGLGADDLLVTGAGLWIGSDNQANTSTCGGKSGHMGICFIPKA